MSFPLGSGSSRIWRNPLDVIAHDHDVQAGICDALERIADGLPEDVDRRLCGQVVSFLRYELPIHHLDEEQGLFPLLRESAGIEEDSAVTGILGQLVTEHGKDESAAEELVEFLDALGRGERPANPELLGYMLRGFFEGYRRHVLWENSFIIPAARRLLSEESLDTLSDVMARNRSQAAPGADVSL
jgi:hemerythrin-like domain-containing protein